MRSPSGAPDIRRPAVPGRPSETLLATTSRHTARIGSAITADSMLFAPTGGADRATFAGHISRTTASFDASTVLHAWPVASERLRRRPAALSSHCNSIRRVHAEGPRSHPFGGSKSSVRYRQGPGHDRRQGAHRLRHRCVTSVRRRSFTRRRTTRLGRRAGPRTRRRRRGSRWTVARPGCRRA